MSCSCGNSNCSKCKITVVSKRGLTGDYAPPLRWLPFTLINGWEVDSPIFYAVSNGILYLRGTIYHSTLTSFTQVFWDAVPADTVGQNGMVYENVAGIVVKLSLLTDNTLAYSGPNNASVYLDLNTSTPIRLYN
jgi:hypothetical protein